MSKLAALVLAAGAGSRFGGRKQLALVNGKPLIQSVIGELSPIFHAHSYVVLGAYATEIRPVIPATVNVLEFADWSSGMGASLAFGIQQLLQHADYEAVLIVLGDQVALRQTDFDALLKASTGEHIVAANYAHQLAVPAIFPKAFFPALAKLSGDSGARKIIQANAEQVIAIELPEAAIDIDTQADLTQFTRLPAPRFAR